MSSTSLVLTVAGLSALICLVVVLTQHWHGHLSHDHDLEGVQKIHETPVPRVGGLGVVLSMVAGWWLLSGSATETSRIVGQLLLCSLPVVLAGFVEDFTKQVSVRTRLLAAFAAAGLAAWLVDSQLTRLSTPLLDQLISYGPFAFAFTVFAAGGVTHSVNIIDGLNGLASGSVAIMLAGLGYMAHATGDTVVFTMCLMGVGACLGFMLLNFPFGKIFMGDGGAYFLGYWLAQCAIMLLVRNPEVSTWAVLLACIYPVWETAYSMVRRSVLSRSGSGNADDQHLHHLLMRNLPTKLGRHAVSAWEKHALATTSIWFAIAVVQLVVILAMSERADLLLLAGMLAFGLMYTGAYGLMADEDDEESAEAAAI